MTPKFHSLKIEDVKQETDDTVSISFEIPSELLEDYTYVSGQYLTLKADINGEDVRRSYSLCSAPYENEWRVAIKAISNGKFSNYANTQLHKGMFLDVMTPTGNFVMNPDPSRNNSYVLFAAGSGITPILSIAKSVLNNEPKSDVTLFYGNKGFNSVIFREELEGLKNRYMDRLRLIHIFSRENLGNKIQKGRIDEAKVIDLYEAFLKDTTIDAVYSCGPEAMILAVKKGLTEKGIDASKIHFELFTAPSVNPETIVEVVDRENIESNITVILDGDAYELHLDSTGQNILDAAQEAGADLPFACKGGVCCTCKAKIIEGSVRMDVNYALEPDEVEAGFILTCQSHPTSDKLIISFDE